MTRSELARTYSIPELYEFLLKSATAPNFRRFGEKPLQEQFAIRMLEWKKIKTVGEQTMKVGENVEDTSTVSKEEDDPRAE